MQTEAETPVVVRQKRFPVVELFGPVIQGEGSQAGQQTMFIRFGGCDYRCQKCDSLHAVMPDAVARNSTYMTAEEIESQLTTTAAETGVKWVTFTGGNPAMHQLGELVHRLKQGGWHINVETQGTLCPDWLLDCTMVTVSPKTFGMGESFEQAKYIKFLEKLRASLPVCVKVVAFYEADLEMALQVEGATEYVYTEKLPFTYPSAERGGVAYYLSLGNPYPPILDPDTMELKDNPELSGIYLARELLQGYQRLSEEVLQDPRLKKWRFLPQLHVLVYGNETCR